MGNDPCAIQNIPPTVYRGLIAGNSFEAFIRRSSRASVSVLRDEFVEAATEHLVGSDLDVGCGMLLLRRERTIIRLIAAGKLTNLADMVCYAVRNHMALP